MSKLNLHNCIRYEQMICTSGQYSKWQRECWPDISFRQDKSYPCKNCSIQSERYANILQQIAKDCKENPPESLQLILKQLNEDAGKAIKFNDNEIGILVCVTTTLEDYYWVYMSADENLYYATCVDSYEVIEMSKELSYIKTKYKDIIKEYVNNNLYDTDAIISDIKI